MAMLKQTYKKTMQGWQLIELLVVVSIVALLAVIAIPKFIDLGSSARRTTILAAAGSMRTVSSILYSACSVLPTCNVQSGPAGGNGLGNSISVQGQSVTLAYGFPRGTAAGIIRAATLDTSSYEIVPGATGTIQVRAPGARLSASCEAEYTQATSPTTPYTVTVTTTGC